MKIRHYALVLTFMNLYFSGFSQDIGKYKKLPVVIKGHFTDLSENDSLEVGASLLVNTLLSGSTQKSETVSSRSFSVLFSPISAPATLSLIVSRITNGKKTAALFLTTSLLLVEPGDTIEISKNKLVFSCSTKDKKIESIKKIYDGVSAVERIRWKGIAEWRPTKSDYEFLDSLVNLKLASLDSIKHKISRAYYYITRINMLCGNQMQKLLREIRLVSKNVSKKELNLSEISMPDPNFPDVASLTSYLIDYYDKPRAELQRLLKQFPQYFPYSDYGSVVLRQYKKDSCLIPDSPFNINKYYLFIKKQFKGRLREYLVANTITYYSLKIPGKGAMIQDALSYLKEEEVRNSLKKLYAGVEGEIAYKFALPDVKGNIIRLDSLKGKIVVLDFWFTGCGGCIAQHPKFERVVDYFSDNPKVIFVSINVDRDTSDWKKSVASGKYTTDSKSNLLNISANRSSTFRDVPIAAAYGLIGCPAMFVINNKGIIESSTIITDNGDNLISQINRLIINSGN